MRARTLLTCFAPLLASSASLLPKDLSSLPASTAIAIPASHQLEFVPGSNDAVLSFDVSHSNDDESLHFSVRVTRPPAVLNCENLQIAINKEELEQHLTFDKFGYASSPSKRITLVTEGVGDQPSRSVSLKFSSFCVHHQEGSLREEKIIKASTFQVVAVDNKPAISLFPSFTTTFIATSLGLDGDLTYPAILEDLSEYRTSDSNELSGLADFNIDDEIARLYQLDEELQGLQNVLEGQKALVINLSKASGVGSNPQLRECTTLSCVLKTFYMKLRFLLIQLRYNINPGLSHDENRPTTQNFMSPSVSISASNTSHSRTRIFLTTLDIVTCFLCLSCLTIYFHSRCCNPRRRAERAAQREESRNRRAYRNLARKQAWKNWWNRRLQRIDDTTRTRDYEEKRSMILAQEAILESAMQQEIMQLRDAEEGRASGSVSESGSIRDEPSSSVRLSRAKTHSRPPTYRSRASSGRPPSYNEVDAPRRGVLDGFHGYTPSGTTATPSGTDCTPDSSVISLSPRHSSETLRTDLSVL